MKFTITRQLQWATGGKPVVEVSVGGLDYSNPDALTEKYPGEFTEFEDPREAVKTAIEICRAWRKDGEKKATVGYGCTGGMTMPFESSSFKAATAWAEAKYASLPKCDGCGGLMPDNEEWQGMLCTRNECYPLGDGFKYCSEKCAERGSIYETEEDR